MKDAYVTNRDILVNLVSLTNARHSEMQPDPFDTSVLSDLQKTGSCWAIRGHPSQFVNLPLYHTISPP